MPFPVQSRPHRQASAVGTPQAATPEFSVAPGSYSSAQTVSITDSTPGAAIYYTTNGTYPWATPSMLYSGPITVSSSEILVAVAVASGYINSDWAFATYLITSVPARFMYTVAGSGTWGNGGDGGPATTAGLSNGTEAIADSSGNLYIADGGNNVVRKVDGKTRIITTIAGTGEPGDTGDGGPATSAKLLGPSYLALDGSGNLYIAENGDCVVRTLNLATGQITRFAGDPNGTSSVGGPAISMALGYILGLAIDATGNLYIGTGSVVIKVDATSGLTSEYVGYGTTPGFQYLVTFAMDSRGNVYGFDIGGVVDKITPDGRITVMAGTKSGICPAHGGDGGPATSACFGGWGHFLATDSDGNLYISDTGNCAIREVNAQTGIINTIGGVFGTPSTIGGDGDPATSSGLFYPQTPFVDSAGNIYVPDLGGYRIREITAPGLPPTEVTEAPAFSLSSGTYANAQSVEIASSTPGAAVYVTFDGSAPLPIGQAYHGPIDLTGSAGLKAVAVAPGDLKSSVTSQSYIITAPPSAIISTVAGTANYGFSPAGGPATSTAIGETFSTAVSPAGDLFIADYSNSAVWKVAATSRILSLVAGNGTPGFSGDGGPSTAAVLQYPLGVAFDKTGNLYIADTGNDRVRMVDAKTGIISTIAGGGSWTADLGDGGPAVAATLRGPAAIAFDSLGSMYIADTNDGRIRRVDRKTGIIITIAGSATSYPPQDGAPATQQNFHAVALGLDKEDDLYIADGYAGRIRRVDAKTSITTTVAGGGTVRPESEGDVATLVAITPYGVAVGPDGDIYFSDSPAVIRKVDMTTGRLSTVAGNTYYGYSGDGGEATIASLSNPEQLTFGPAGNLLIADAREVVRKVTFRSPAAMPSLSLASGAYTGGQTVSITDATPNATIYYTLDGSTPDSGSSVYSGPITITKSATLQAIAVISGYAASPVAKADYTITMLTPSITLTSSSASAFVSNAVTFTATFASASASPTGSVTFLDGTATLGTGTMSNGVATYTTSSLTTGTHSITAAYAGDNNFSSATSAAITQTIEDFAFAPPSNGSTSATVQPGGTASYTLAITPPTRNTTASDVTFSVTGLPSGATSNFNPAKVAAGSGATNVTLSVTVPAQSAALHTSEKLRLAFGLLILPLLGFRRNLRSACGKLLLVLFVLSGALAMSAFTGCGGSGSSSQPNPQPKSRTYTLTVTATAGNLTHNTKLTLTVQ